MEIGKEFVFGPDKDELKWFMKPSIEGTDYSEISGNLGLRYSF